MDDFDLLVSETLSHLQELRADRLSGLVKYKIEHTIQYGRSVPQGHGWEELMSDWWFKTIAKRLAP